MSDLKQAVAESHFHAMRCHYHLRDRIGDDAPISVQTLAHEDGGGAPSLERFGGNA